MKLIQIALLLQITGFFLGSVTLALVEIESIKGLADAFKRRIIAIAHGHPWVTADVIAIKFLIAASKQIFVDAVVSKRANSKVNMLNSSASLFSSIQTILQLLTAFIAFYLARLPQIAALRLSGNRTMTRMMIVAGAILLLAGLILELISV